MGKAVARVNCFSFSTTHSFHLQKKLKNPLQKEAFHLSYFYFCNDIFLVQSFFVYRDGRVQPKPKNISPQRLNTGILGLHRREKTVKISHKIELFVIIYSVNSWPKSQKT